jgi:hypothetical protein
MNAKQCIIYNAVMTSINKNTPQLYFVDGSGATGGTGRCMFIAQFAQNFKVRA